MDKKSIIGILEKNELSQVEEIEYKEGSIVLRFFYDFDEDEIEAARAYANDESEDEENSNVWFEEFFLPYLSDIAVDTAGEVIEEIMEDLDIDAQFVSYEIDEEEYNYNEFVAAFSPKGKAVEIEKVLDELEM
ncbi:hypothetical protein NBE98_08795 [Clostridium swellfunianum]|uniref:hypothetical protein n=1 Tax=Clostridium swellfunianum TaxID=1367462 RepID=UPI00202EFD76|nr:hypothetical protein [Clostridium swellfunianum]MCM0648471.1 hypothetical protein [Clostridium swellfunianum]